MNINQKLTEKRAQDDVKKMQDGEYLRKISGLKQIKIHGYILSFQVSP